MTRTPATVSSTTEASSADSRWMPITWGCSVRENRVAITLRNGSAPSASRVRTGSMIARITVTASTVTPLEMVSGIMTRKFWTCCRSVLARLISWPVCTLSWNAKCSRCTWANSRSRRSSSIHRASRNAR
jgi:hypothetical protein